PGGRQRHGTALVRPAKRPGPRKAARWSWWPLPPRLPGRGSGHHQRLPVFRDQAWWPEGRRRRKASPPPAAQAVSARGTPPGPPLAEGPILSSRGSGAALEQAGHRPVAEDLLDGPRDERGDREHGELVEPLLRRDGQGAGDDDLADPGVLQL